MTITTLSARPAPRIWPAFLLVTFIVSLILGALMPPFSAPDEFDHIKRAYMFGQGQLLLHSQSGSPSGGYVDSGLVDFMDAFGALPGHNAQKISGAELDHAGAIAWTGTDRFVTPVGTSYYFPALYAPQAIGLSTGKALGLSVNKSYRLARLFALVTCLLLLAFACRIFPPPPAVMAVLVLPMNLFLFASPSLDGMTTATAAVALAAFMRLATERQASPSWVFWVFAVALLLVGACRANAAPFLLLPFVVWWFMRDRRSLAVAVALGVAVVGWTLFTMKYTVYPPGARHIDHTARLASYIIHPGRFFSILYATLADPGVRGYYISSFIGALGWLDTSLPVASYRIFGILFLIAFAFSFSRDAIVEHRLARGVLVLCAIATLLMTYLAMLVQWTIGDSPIIQGVQGRYFMIPALAIAFAFGGDYLPRASVPHRIGIAAAGLILLLAAYLTPQTVAMRYFAENDPVASRIQTTLVPTAVLTRDHALGVSLNPSQVAEPAALSSMDVMFGTYNRSNPGDAELRVWTRDGDTTIVPFQLASLTDNGYHRFPLGGKRYIGAEIVSRGGEGVSVWTVRIGDSVQLSCVGTLDDAGHVLTTLGCPAPAP
ncbi:DUF2142 domain-containing protein [Luteibacter pinisoli]|uniref:DUF2142 domain-containing protein n=1 Tax=Luteibacter pinisoli TaxID=2589080 RepID=A0A4Y5Z0B1_9GAMM|nr:DUF2142 domain-containing protein [Luteibacter pinisoli]QDE38497.1 DUF2142 domain-containing protein [Luteibacter pinisoli]